MDKRVQFENVPNKPAWNQNSSKNKNAKNESPSMDPAGVKADGNQSKAQRKKQMMNFEEFLKKNETKPKAKLDKQKPPNDTVQRKQSNRLGQKNESPATQPKTQNPKKLEGILRDRSPKVVEPLDQPDERSLENIFATGSVERQEAYEPPSKQQTNDFTLMAKESEQIRQLQDNHLSSQLQAETALNKSNLTSGDDNGNNKNIRGLFKKEIYGNDESKKKEAQLRMKRELEYQMEQNKQKKDQEKRAKEEEEKREQERHQRYLEKEKERKLEEERKELEIKRKKEQISQQNLAKLEEAQRLSQLEKKNKFAQRQLETPESLYGASSDNNTMANGRKPNRDASFLRQPSTMAANSRPTENLQQEAAAFNPQAAAPVQLHQNYFQPPQTNPHSYPLHTHDHFGGTNFTDATRHHPNQYVSPPSMPTGEAAAFHGLSHEAQALLYQRQFTPMTNFSNHDSIPVEKNVLEGLIKENQGLKQEANRNNMILDLLTNALFKKQAQAGSTSLVMNGNQKLPNPRLREEPRTADGHPSHQIRGGLYSQGGHLQQAPTGKQKRDFRINTPVNQQVYQKQNYGKKEQRNFPPADAYRKLKSSSPSQLKHLQGNNQRGLQKMSSMLEEFQDIDNFQHIDNFQQGQLEEPEPQFFDFKEQPFDEAVEFNNFDYERDSGFQFGFNQQAPMYHRAAPGFFGDIDSQESHMLPPVNKNDIKLRSEKYKNEIATKLSKIKNELNTKDHKIEQLLSRIGATGN